jgi:hypothetical protein
LSKPSSARVWVDGDKNRVFLWGSPNYLRHSQTRVIISSYEGPSKSEPGGRGGGPQERESSRPLSEASVQRLFESPQVSNEASSVEAKYFSNIIANFHNQVTLHLVTLSMLLPSVGCVCQWYSSITALTGHPGQKDWVSKSSYFLGDPPPDPRFLASLGTLSLVQLHNCLTEHPVSRLILIIDQESKETKQELSKDK